MRISKRLRRVLGFAALGVLALAAAIAGGSCSTTPTVLPSRDFNRPTDVVFACVGFFDGTSPDGGVGNQMSGFSGRPIDWCQPFGVTAPAADDQHHTFAFIPNSDSGELSVVDADKGKLVDLDPSVSGYSRLPLGVLPEQIAVSDDGCRLVTANRGSCDLTVVNPALLLAPTIKPGTSAGDGGAPPGATDIARTVVPRTSSGQLQAAPQEVRFLPQDTFLLTGSDNLCTGDTTYGVQPQPGDAHTAALTTWKALVTFPSCDLIATIDLPSGEIIDSAYVRQAGDGSLTLVPAGADPHCSADCGTVNRERVVSDAGAADAGGDDGSTGADGGTAADGSTSGGGATTAPANGSYFGPSGIDIVPPTAAGYGIHAYVSLSNAPQIVSLDVSADGLITATPARPFIPLQDAVGSNRVRLSVNPNLRGLGGKTMGRFVDEAHPERQYLYAIARDGTVRVVQVAKQPETECETSINPQNPPPGYDPQAACTPVTTDSYKYRRPFAVGPGLRFGSIPIDVGFADTRYNPKTIENQPLGTVLELGFSGTFAWVATSSGSVFLVNIDPVPRSIWSIKETDDATVTLGTVGSTSCGDSTPCVPESLPPVNTLRDANVQTFSRGLSPAAGPPRLNLPPVIPSSGPRIATLWTEGTANNATAIAGGTHNPTYVYFPDRAAVNAQSWVASWQGLLSGGPRFSGQVFPSPPQLQDPGSSFCLMGAQVGDLVTFTGCVDNNQCGVGRVCLHGSGTTEAAGGLTVGGICVEPNNPDASTSNNQDLPTICANELATLRRYTVTNLTDHAVALEPHIDELAFSNLRACADLHRSTGGTTAGAADGGAADGGAADGGPGGASDCSDPTDSTTTNFRCTDLTASGVSGVTGTRCVQTCKTPGSTIECRAGRVCVSYDASQSCDPAKNNCLCADAPRLDNPNCGYNQLTPFQVNAGRAFLVSGSATALPTARKVLANGQCGGPVSDNPRAVSRISMDTGPMSLCLDANGTPINMTGVDTRCTPAGTPGESCANNKNLFQLLQKMPSPNPCLFIGGANDTDPVGQSGTHVNAMFRNTEVAFIVTNLEWAPAIPQDLRFDVHGGFRSLPVFLPPTVELSMPGRIVVGPLMTSTPPVVVDAPYLFVVDQRALGRTQAGGPTPGQLLRIHPFGFADTNGAYEPWFEDYTHSNNQYPIR